MRSKQNKCFRHRDERKQIRTDQTAKTDPTNL